MDPRIAEIVVLVILILLVAWIIVWMFRSIQFYKTRYAKQTGARYLQTIKSAGSRGEYKLGRQLEKFDPKGLMLFNVYVPKGNGETSEVDAILVSPSGVYVFENKNYSGWIFGKLNDKTWTQTLNRKSKYRFLNPIRQNAGHVAALSHYLGISEQAFEPIVVFADKTVLKRVSAGDATILHTSQVATRLKSIASKRQVTFDDKVVDAIYSTLCQCANATEEEKKAHVDRIKEKKQKRQRNNPRKSQQRPSSSKTNKDAR